MSEHNWMDERYADAAFSSGRAHSEQDFRADGALSTSAPSATQQEPNPLRQQMLGRIAFLRDAGRVKDPALLEEAVAAIDGLVAATQALLDDMGTSDDGIEANLMDACRAAIAATGAQA